MRLRFTVLALLLTALVAGVIPAVGSAAPRHNHGVTINAIPHSILAGEDALVYGHLKGGTVSNQPIVLYQHLGGFRGGYVPVGSTHTDSRGFYEFTESNVSTNRSWFTRGPGNSHSRTVFERVAALVTPPTTSSSTIDTNHRVVFTGSVTPAVHPFDRVLLQQQVNGSDDWRTLKVARLDRDSTYAIPYRFRVPGERDLRVVFRGDRRNTRGVSDSTTITVEQGQVSGFTINTSDPVITYGSSAQISGVLDQPGTTTPEPNTPVKLCSRSATESRFTCTQVAATGSDGGYSFTVTPPVNELYQVRTSLPPKRHTAVLFEGVKDIVTLTASSTTSTVNGTVTFNGTVTPDKAGHVIYLQRLGKDDDWHTVEVRIVKSDSTYQFSWTFGATGSKEFRTRILSDKRNVGAASPPVTIAVGPAPASALPPAS
jgi:hypothetical protein